MIRTDNFNETIRDALAARHVYIREDLDLLVEKGELLPRCPFTSAQKTEAEMLDWWMTQLRQHVPAYATLSWQDRGDSIVIVVEIEKEPDPGMCDKCGLPVAKQEDGTLFAAILEGANAIPFVSGKRHIRCSPSRAQYIVHPNFPPVFDHRETFDKRLLDAAERRARELRYTAAWEQLQRECRQCPS